MKIHAAGPSRAATAPLGSPHTSRSTCAAAARQTWWWRSSGTHRHLPRCQAAAEGDVGRLLRDALTQPPPANPAFLAAANYLRGLGISNQTDVARVLDLAMNPNSLYGAGNRKQPTNPHARKLDVEADMKPVVELLLAAGLAQEQVVKAILVHPPLLCYSAQERLQPFFYYLTQEVGLSKDEAATVVQRRPSLLGVEVDGLRRIVAFLLDSGSSKEEVVELMATTL